MMENISESGVASCDHQEQAELAESSPKIIGTSQSSPLPANSGTSRAIKSVDKNTYNRLMLTQAYGSSCEIEDEYEKGSEESIERVNSWKTLIVDY